MMLPLSPFVTTFSPSEAGLYGTSVWHFYNTKADKCSGMPDTKPNCPVGMWFALHHALMPTARVPIVLVVNLILPEHFQPTFQDRESFDAHAL